ncbi:inhibitor of growth protein 4 [Salmo trutta]|uniref:inhibitor of growth protein 4 n=1 Tax=Salmo trutta TaxID=8032 RepID=UPI0011304C17|nr:inhibitor of growth protein 4-like [Salmo trutta]
MAAGMYLEHYLDSIENLPFELQRNFTLMRDLDTRTEDLKGQINSLACEYTSNAHTLSSEQGESTDYDSTSSKGNKSELRGPKEKKVARTRLKAKSDDDCSPKSGQKKVKLTQTPEFTAPTVNFGNVHPSDVLDMPVDPNEPTYCLCHQVSYGEMIGCHNTDCSIEWFHFACVGLTTKPRGKWYCPRCTQERKRK